MRLGRHAVVFAVLSVAVSLVAAGSPAGSARRDDDRDRKQMGDRKRSSDRSHRAREANTGAPAGFVAELGGRIVVVSAETGRVERYLTAAKPGGAAKDPAVSPDGRRVWFSRRDGRCAAHLASVPVAGGDEKKLPGSGEAGPEGMPLPRPGRAQVAYARTDCDTAGQSLIVGDLAGLEGHGQIGLLPLAWSRKGDHLLATTADGDEVRLLEVSDSGAIVDNQSLVPADDGTGECRLKVLGFSPDANDGYVAVRRCGSPGPSARRTLVLLGQDGRYRKTVLRLPRGHDFLDRPAFDPTGHSLLFSTAPAASDDRGDQHDHEVSLWLWRDGRTRPLARQSRYRHPAWLP